MARTPAQRGPIGRYLTRKRTERYRTQEEALADMRRLAGLAISVSEYAQWESGSRVPREDNPKLQRLIEFFGGHPEEEVVRSPQSDSEALVAAIDRLTAAVELLVERHTEGTTATAQMLGAVLGRLGGLPERTPDGAAGHTSGSGR